jgi:hypothetical protein
MYTEWQKCNYTVKSIKVEKIGLGLVGFVDFVHLVFWTEHEMWKIGSFYIP